jgi:iron-sulfur cluster insertion protein
MRDFAATIGRAPGAGAERGLIELTHRAAAVARRVRDEEGLAGQALRASVAGGGCSGFRFDLYFDEEVRPGDAVIEHASHGLVLVVDMMSALYLEGATIDYVEGLHGAGFKFELPARASSCGGCAASRA